MVTRNAKLQPLDDARREPTTRVLLAGDQNFLDTAAEALDADGISLIDTARTGDALMEKLAHGETDCIVIDRKLGKLSSTALRESILAKQPNPVPMVLLTSEGDAKTVVEAFRNGFSDYVVRGQNSDGELVQAVRRAVTQHRKRQSLFDEIEYLSRIAKYDRLTGLPNRNFLEDRLLSLIASGQRHNSEFALFLIDLNNFRQINDIYGHAVGDQALRAFARQLTATSRSSDSLGRFGGDEFLYLVDHDVSYERIELACARLADALSFSVELEHVGLSLSASIGAVIYPRDGTTPDELLTAADHAMYTAKANGVGHCLANTISSAPAGDVTQTNGKERKPHNRKSRGDSPRETTAAPAETLGRVTNIAHRDENRRAERRNRVFQRGRIILGDGFSTIDCMIRDLSSRGARVTVEDVITVPQRFSFAILASGTVHFAIRRWQNGRSIGVEFQVDGQGETTSAAGKDARLMAG